MTSQIENFSRKSHFKLSLKTINVLEMQENIFFGENIDAELNSKVNN